MYTCWMRSANSNFPQWHRESGEVRVQQNPLVVIGDRDPVHLRGTGWWQVGFSIHFTGCFQGRSEKKNSKKERLWPHTPDLTPAYI
jgi:hypothetical protein